MSIYLDEIYKPIKEFIMLVMKATEADKAKKTSPEQTFYCVMAEFYRNGTVKAAIATRVCREKPRNTMRVLPIMTAYTTWYESRSEAEALLALTRRAA
jgi:hypothetical protein